VSLLFSPFFTEFCGQVFSFSLSSRCWRSVSGSDLFLLLLPSHQSFFFLFPIIFHSPQKLKNPLRISSKKDKKQKKKKEEEEEAIFLFISLSADGRV
jgi:hypothetical protein